MPLFDCDELLGKLKARGAVPVSAGTWTDARLLEAMSDEAETWLMPLLINAQTEYLTHTQDIAFVAGQADYRFSSRAAGIREVSRIMAGGAEVPLEEYTAPTQTQHGVIPSTQGVPQWYKFQKGVITLYPVPGGTGESLRVKYHYRLNRLVSAADCVIITAVTQGAGTGGSTRLTVAGASTGTGGVPQALLTAAGSTQKLDFVRGTPMFDVMGFDITPAAAFILAATSIDVAAASLPSGVAVGDYIAAQRRTPVPNMPPELHVCAGLRAAAAAVGSKGDKTLQKSLLEEAEGKEASLLSGILSPRSKGNSHRIVNRRWR